MHVVFTGMGNHAKIGGIHIINYGGHASHNIHTKTLPTLLDHPNIFLRQIQCNDVSNILMMKVGTETSCQPYCTLAASWAYQEHVIVDGVILWDCMHIHKV